MIYKLVILLCLAAALLSAQRRSGGMRAGRGSRSGSTRAPQGGNGHLEIDTELKNLSVFIDERLAGKPGKKKFTLPSGGHSVELKDPLGKSCKQNVLIAQGETVKVHCTPAAVEAEASPQLAPR